MVLNVTDEVINGTPKYNITPNGDGTNSIELANVVVSDGTPLNKALFDKIENVLSYQVPSVNQSLISSTSETYSGTMIPTDITPTWTTRGENLGNAIVQNLTKAATTHLNIIPKIEYISKLNNFVADGIDTPTTSDGIYSAQSGRYYTSNAFLDNSKRTSYSSSYNNYFSTRSDNIIRIIWDFKESCKPTFNIRIAMDGISSIILYGSDDKENWTEITRNSIFTNYKSPNYFRYYRLGFYLGMGAFYGIGIYYNYISAVEYKVNTYSNAYNLPNNLEFLNNQRVLIQTPNVLGIATSNTLNGINIDTSLNANKYYELVYNQSQNKFTAQEVLN